MEDLVKAILQALAPSPLAQGIVIGLAVAGIGAWALRRGLQESARRDGGEDDKARAVRIELTDEEKRREWAAFEHLRHIEANSFEIMHHLERLTELMQALVEAFNRFNDKRWNDRQ